MSHVHPPIPLSPESNAAACPPRAPRCTRPSWVRWSPRPWPPLALRKAKTTKRNERRAFLIFGGQNRKKGHPRRGRKHEAKKRSAFDFWEQTTEKRAPKTGKKTWSWKKKKALGKWVAANEPLPVFGWTLPGALASSTPSCRRTCSFHLGWRFNPWNPTSFLASNFEKGKDQTVHGMIYLCTCHSGPRRNASMCRKCRPRWVCRCCLQQEAANKCPRVGLPRRRKPSRGRQAFQQVECGELFSVRFKGTPNGNEPFCGDTLVWHTHVGSGTSRHRKPPETKY